MTLSLGLLILILLSFIFCPYYGILFIGKYQQRKFNKEWYRSTYPTVALYNTTKLTCKVCKDYIDTVVNGYCDHCFYVKNGQNCERLECNNLTHTYIPWKDWSLGTSGEDFIS